MSSVLEKTIQSLETALRYKPDNLEVMTSLAEAYLRSGRFDHETNDLIERALKAGGENELLTQAHQIRLVVEQVEHIETSLLGGTEPPDDEALQIGSDMLAEYLQAVPVCREAWLAWTRVQLLRGKYENVERGIAKLRKTDEDNDLRPLFNNCLQYRLASAGDDERPQLARVLALLGDADGELALLEKEYSSGRVEIGRELLACYDLMYKPENAREVPEEKRKLLLDVVLAHGAPMRGDEWLEAASAAGWNFSAPLKARMRTQLDQGLFAEAFATAKRMPMDHAVKTLLNEMAEAYEKRDQFDEAVELLRYINDNEISAEADAFTPEQELERDALLSMAEIQIRNGRYDEALRKFVHAVTCCDKAPDPMLIDRIDRLVDEFHMTEPDSLVNLARHFRKLENNPKAVYYLNQALSLFPNNEEAMQELEDLFGSLLDLDANLPEIRMELGRLYRRMGRLADAADQITIAAASPMIMPRANRMLAEIKYEQGIWNESLIHFSTAALTERDAESLYRIYQGLMGEGKEKEALEALRLIKGVVPGYRDLPLRISELETKYGTASANRAELYIDPKMKELIGDLSIGRYEYIGRLGSGGMGVVHKVFDLRNNKAVAMKILRDSLSSSTKALDRFFREARIAASIHNRNIVEIYDYNISNVNGQSYIAMELVEGPSMREIIDRQFEGGAPPTREFIAEMVYYSIQLCDALQASHEKGIVHRDIKPDNILVNLEGEVKITDFGIVHIEEATFTPSGAMIGTPRYMAPEQVTGGKIDGRSDIYSTGILIYEIVTGAPPFLTGDISYQQVNNIPAMPHDVCDLVSESLSRVIIKCLEKKPPDRYQSATQLKLALLEELDAMGGCEKYNRIAAQKTDAGLDDIEAPPDPDASWPDLTSVEDYAHPSVAAAAKDPRKLAFPEGLGLDDDLDLGSGGETTSKSGLGGDDELDL